jgi:CRP/FNR family transcriptional regulator
MSDEVKYWHLRNHKLFWVLNNSQVRQLCIITNFKKARKGEIIDFGHSDVPRIYLLKKGNIKIVKIDEEGNELIIDVIQKGELFGELGFGEMANSNEYAKVLTDNVILCSFNVKDFERVLTEFPSLAITYTKIVGFQLKRVKNSYSNLFFKTAKQRLIAFLRDWIEREGKVIEGRAIISNYLTQEEISQIICTSRQTVTLIFNEWEQRGLIVYGRKEIIIENLKMLN